MGALHMRLQRAEALGLPCPLWQQHSMKTEHQRSLDCTWLSAIRACGWSRSFTVSDPIETNPSGCFSLCLELGLSSRRLLLITLRSRL